MLTKVVITVSIRCSSMQDVTSELKKVTIENHVTGTLRNKPHVIMRVFYMASALIWRQKVIKIIGDS